MLSLHQRGYRALEAAGLARLTNWCSDWGWSFLGEKTELSQAGLIVSTHPGRILWRLGVDSHYREAWP